MVSVLRLVFKIWWWREEGALPLAPAVYQGHAFLLSIKGGVVIAGQGQVGSDAFPKAIAEKGLIHTKWVPGSLGVLLQSGHPLPVEGLLAQGDGRVRDPRCGGGRALSEAGCGQDTAQAISHL